MLQERWFRKWGSLYKKSAWPTNRGKFGKIVHVMRMREKWKKYFALSAKSGGKNKTIFRFLRALRLMDRQIWFFVFLANLNEMFTIRRKGKLAAILNPGNTMTQWAKGADSLIHQAVVCVASWKFTQILVENYIPEMGPISSDLSHVNAFLLLCVVKNAISPLDHLPNSNFSCVAI